MELSVTSVFTPYHVSGLLNTEDEQLGVAGPGWARSGRGGRLADQCDGRGDGRTGGNGRAGYGAGSVGGGHGRVDDGAGGWRGAAGGQHGHVGGGRGRAGCGGTNNDGGGHATSAAEISRVGALGVRGTRESILGKEGGCGGRSTAVESSKTRENMNRNGRSTRF